MKENNFMFSHLTIACSGLDTIKRVRQSNKITFLWQFFYIKSSISIDSAIYQAKIAAEQQMNGQRTVFAIKFPILCYFQVGYSELGLLRFGQIAVYFGNLYPLTGLNYFTPFHSFIFAP